MKSLFKKIFSRVPLVAVTILALILIFFALVIGGWYLGAYIIVEIYPVSERIVAIVLTILDNLVLIIAVVNVVSRDLVPETKIPWILCIVVLNLLGVFIYILFSSHRPSRKQRKLYKELYVQNMTEDDPAPEEDLRSEVGQWTDVCRALCASDAHALLRANTNVEYFPSGELFFERVISDLEKAEKFIFLEYFIVEKGKMWNTILDILVKKANEGVEVRFMYDDIGSMGKVRAGYYKKLRKLGLKAQKFNHFVPVLTTLHNNRDHRKILVIDGKIGYTGGLNLADEYINETHPFGYWKDNAIRLEGEGVVNLTRMFLGMYQLSTKTVEDITPYLVKYGAEGSGFVQPYGGGPYPMYERHLAEDVYVNIINSAHDYLWITTPYLIVDYRMKQALLLAAKRGVDVRIVTPHIPDKKIVFALTRSSYMALIKGGVKIYEFTPGFVHAKMFLSDDMVGTVGTVNLDYRSFLYHFEDGVVLYNIPALADIKQDFTETFAVSQQQTEEDAKKSPVWRWLCEIAKIFAPLF